MINSTEKGSTKIYSMLQQCAVFVWPYKSVSGCWPNKRNRSALTENHK